jgi:uncharacterized repeat protein (TIGR01451 family)
MKIKFTLTTLAILLCIFVQNSFAQLTANAGADQTICAGMSANLGGSPTASGGTPSYTYSWSSSPAGYSSLSANPSAIPSVTTTYFVTVTDAASNTATDQVVITVNPIPTIAITGQTNICAGQCVTITASGGTTYTWCCGIVPNPSVTVCPTTTTTYTVTASNGGCTSSANVTVVVDPQLLLNVTTTDETCQLNDGSATANITGGFPPYYYQWNIFPSPSSQTIANLAPGAYNVTVTDANGCYASWGGTVLPYVFNPQILASPDTVCSGASSILTAQGGIQYQWSNGATTSSVTVNPATTTSYTVTISDGCSSLSSVSITVVVNGTATAEAGNDVVICPGGSVMLQASGGVSYSWSPSTNISAINISNPVVNPSVTTMYYVIATSSCGTAIDSVLVNVTISGSLIANAGIDYNINPGSCVWLGSNPGASGGTPPYNFSWSNGMTGNYINICPATAILYTLTVTDAGGCLATDENSIAIIGSSNWKISGTVFLDSNGDGIQNNGEEPYDGVVVQKNPYLNYSYVSPGSTDGKYNFYLATTGTYNISIPSTSPYYTISPSSYTVNISTSGQNDTLNNFAFHPMPNVRELQIDNYVWNSPRPGFDNNVTLVYKNNGTIPMSGSVILKHDPLCNYVSSYPSPSSISGDSIIWTFSNLLIGESRNIVVQQLVSALTPLGTSINLFSQILPIANDTFPANNYDSLHLIVVGSYDPNDKSVIPDRPLVPTEIANADPLTYVIRFQNTGTYYAEKVFVRDTLSPELDISSFEMIGASHKYSMNYYDPGILEWMFDSIMLPDSATNEAGSHGFISYRIRPKTTLTEQDTIKNTAYIYFDFNTPVITNTTSSFLDANTGIETGEISQVSGKIKTYPNPFKNTVTLELPANIEYPCKVYVFNELSEQVFTKEITSSISTINSGSWSHGFCYFRIIDKQGNPVGTGKLIKQ